jgi:hypothetical protein
MNRGQSLIELIIAIGIFVFVISALSFLILDSYISGRLATEITKADFLAQEGLEAARSIRDNSWSDLTSGNHGLAISGGHWTFQGTSEDISSQLKGGTRIITVENIDPNRKKISSIVDWQFYGGRIEEAKLVTYLTNWQKISVGYCTGTCTPCENFLTRTTCLAQDGCRWIARLRICTGACTPCQTFIDQPSCEAQSGCYWTWE